MKFQTISILKKIIPITLSLVLLNCGPSEKEIEVNGNRYRLTFYDEFDGNGLDIEKWGYRTDSKHWSTQLPANLEVKEGFLYLHLKKEKSMGKDYTGAGVISKDTFKYGYYEASLKVPKGSGWHTSFWLMRTDGSGGTESSKATIEIDILENDSKDTLGYKANLHKWIDGHINYGGEHIEAQKLNEEFQVLSCEYTPEYINYYLNGKKVKTTDISEIPQGDLNIWLTSIASHLGQTEFVDDSKLPSYAVFDYVRFYELID